MTTVTEGGCNSGHRFRVSRQFQETVGDRAHFQVTDVHNGLFPLKMMPKGMKHLMGKITRVLYFPSSVSPPLFTPLPKINRPL